MKTCCELGWTVLTSRNIVHNVDPVKIVNKFGSLTSLFSLQWDSTVEFVVGPRVDIAQAIITKHQKEHDKGLTAHNKFQRLHESFVSNVFVISTKTIFFVLRVFLAAVVRRTACQLWRDFYTNFHGDIFTTVQTRRRFRRILPGFSKQ